MLTRARTLGNLRRSRLDVILVIIVLAVALWVFSTAATWVEYNGDEGGYIARSYYFGYLFLLHDVTRKEWGDNYVTHTQPMIARYIVGASLWLRGYALQDFPLRFHHYEQLKSLDENRALGLVPDDAVIADARRPMVWLAAGSTALLYLLGRMLGGPVAGLASAGLMLASPFAQEYLVRALTDSPLCFSVLLALLFGIVGSRRGAQGSVSAGWAIALGLALGLGVGTKLTALLGVAATFLWGLLAATLSARSQQPAALLERLGKAWLAGRGWLLAVTVGLAVFVLSDPHLYPNPLLHTRHMLDERVYEAQIQQREIPWDAVLNPLERPGLVLAGSLLEGTWGGSRGVPIEAALAAIGLGVALKRCWRGFSMGRALPTDCLVIITLASYFAGISAALYLAWPRYYMPFFLICLLLAGLGAGSAVRLARSAAAGWQPTARPRAAHGYTPPVAE